MWVLIPIALLAVVVWGLLARARLLRLRRHAETLWDQMAAHLETRWDLIPRLLEELKRHIPDRESLLAHVASAREHAMSAETLPDHAAAERELNDALFRVLALFLERTDLQDDLAIQTIQDQLAEADDAIQLARMSYNGIVSELNRIVTTFPRSVVASFSGVRACDYYARPGEEPDSLGRGLA